MKSLAAASAGIMLMGLSACASPQTAYPHATTAEIRAETLRQHQYLRDMRAQGLVVGGTNKKAAAPRLKAVAERIAPASISLCRDMQLPDAEGCAYSLHMKRSAEDNPQAYTDGYRVYISSSMIRHATTDDELALVVAHEFAHNIMQHQRGIQRNMIVGGLIGATADVMLRQDNGGAALGAEAGLLSYSPSFEHEADYIALYMIARAGYDYDQAIDFWRRISLTIPESIYFSNTHPTNPERFVVMQKTVEEIHQKRKNGTALIPQRRTASTHTAYNHTASTHTTAPHTSGNPTMNREAA